MGESCQPAGKMTSRANAMRRTSSTSSLDEMRERKGSTVGPATYDGIGDAFRLLVGCEDPVMRACLYDTCSRSPLRKILFSPILLHHVDTIILE